MSESKTEITAVFNLKSVVNDKQKRTVQCRTVPDKVQSCYDQSQQNTFNYYNTVEPVCVEALLTFLSDQGLEKSFLAYLEKKNLNLSTLSQQTDDKKFDLSLDYLLKVEKRKYKFSFFTKEDVFLQLSLIEEDETKPIPLVGLKVKFQELKFWLDIQNIISKTKDHYIFHAEIIAHNIAKPKSYLVFGEYNRQEKSGELEIII